MARITGPTDPTLTAPPWAGDFMSRDHLVPGPLRLDASQFPTRDRVAVVVDSAGAAGDATTIPLKVALTGAIPNSTTLYFGGSKKLAILTAAAAVGATSLTVQALPTALIEDDTAYYQPNADVPIPSGTAVGRTLAERDAGTGFGPAINTDDEIFLVAFAIDNAVLHPDFEAYRHGGQVKEDLLPEWGDTTYWPTALVTVLRGLYLMTLSG